MNPPRPPLVAPCPHQIRWWMLPAFVGMSIALGVILTCALLIDFGRWLLSPLWPIEPRHPERPGP